MNEDLSLFFARCKNIRMHSSEREDLLHALETWASRQWHPDAAQVDDISERWTLAGASEDEAIILQANIPLFFGTWSGVRMFSVVKPFYASIVKEQ